MLLGIIGCSIGGVARHCITTLAAVGRGESFPWGTLVVNVFGSGLMGAFYGLRIEYGVWAYLLLGFCGGFTTFSAFSLQNLSLLSEGRRFGLIFYIILSIGLSLTAMLLVSTWVYTKYW